MAQKILIVEDDPIARRVYHEALKGAGFEVSMAVDANSGLSEAQKQRPSLVLLDLGLPAGGGFVFLQRFRMFPHFTATPVVVVSGQERATAEPRAMEAGATRYIEKPVKPPEIVTAVRDLIGAA